MSSDEQVKRLEEVLSKLLSLKPEEREILARIIREHKPQKIVKALNDIILYDKRGKARARITLEEFEKMLKKVRF
jgi:Mn-dependent DtxR family transcriptional regulator